MVPTRNTAAPTTPQVRPRCSRSVSTAGRPRVRANAAKVYITAIVSQRPPSTSTAVSVSLADDPALAGLTSEPRTSDMAPTTRALAESGTQSLRMHEI
jgi:hypothetical protein